MQSDQRDTCNLRGKIVGLTLAKTEQPLPFLKDDFQGTIFWSKSCKPQGIRVSCPCRAIRSTVPRLLLRMKKSLTGIAGKDNIRAHVAASEFAGIPLFSSFAENLDDGGSVEVLLPEVMLRGAGITNLYHSDIVTLEVSAVDELDNLGTREPTVCQYIAELDLVRDCPSYHLYGKANLVHVVLTDSTLKRSVRSPFRSMYPREFLGAHSKVSFLALLALFAYEGKIKQHLAHAIREAKEERLESGDAFVLKVKIDTSDVLYTLACLWEIRVINHQAGVYGFVVTAYPDLCPQLRTDMAHELAPVGAGVIEEIIEDILSAPKLAA